MKTLRLLFFGDKAEKVESRKFPLFAPEEGLTSELAELIHTTYLYLFGPLNIDHYLQQWQLPVEERVYSVLDFWMDALRLGGVFAPAANKMATVLSQLGGGKTVYQSALEKSPLKDLLNMTDTEKFLIAVSKKMAGSTREGRVKSITKKIEKCFLDDKNLTGTQQSDIQKLAEAIDDAKDNATQQLLKQKFFGITLETSQEKAPATFTFCLVPGLGGEILDRKNPNSFFISRLSHLAHLTPRGDARSCLSMIGIESNGSGDAFSNFLNSQKGMLGMLKRSEIQPLHDFMIASHSGWCGKEDVLQGKLEELSQLAQKLPDSPFLNSWHHFRNFFHSRLDSHFAVWFDRIDEITEAINLAGKRPKDIEKKIEDLSDFEKAFALIEHVKSKKVGVAQDVLDRHQGLIKLLDDLSLAVLDPDKSLLDIHEAIQRYALVHTSLSIFLKGLLYHADEEFKISIYPKVGGPKKEEDEGKAEKNGKNGKNGKDKKEKKLLLTFGSLFRVLSKPLKGIRNFFGQTLRGYVERLSRTPFFFASLVSVWEEMTGDIMELGKGKQTYDESFFRHRLQSILRTYRACDTSRFQKVLEHACKPYVNLKNVEEYQAIWKRKIGENKETELMPLKHMPTDFYQASVGLIKVLLTIGFDWKKLTNCERADFLRIHTLIGSLMSWVQGGRIDVSQYDWQGSPRMELYLNTRRASQLPMEVGGLELSEFLESYFFPELNNFHLLLRRKHFASSSSLQFSGDKHPELICQFINWEDAKRQRDSKQEQDATTIAKDENDTPTEQGSVRGFTRKPSLPKNMDSSFFDLGPTGFFQKCLSQPLSENLRREMLYHPHWWGYRIAFQLATPQQTTVNALNAEKMSRSGIVKETSSDQQPTVWIKTAHHELQYLEWILSVPEKKFIHCTPGQPYLYVSKKIPVTWDLETQSGTFDLNKPLQPFMIQPVTLTPDVSKIQATWVPGNYVGYDFGHKSGVVRAVITVDKEKGYKVIERATLKDPQFAALDRQSRMPKEPVFQPLPKGASRKMQSTRDSLQHRLWNWLFEAMCRTQSKLVIESSVGGSSTKGQWLRNMHAEMQKAVTNGFINQKLQKGLFGGYFKDDRTVALIVNASGTSQFCLEGCHRWWQTFLSGEKDSGEVVAYDNMIVTFKIQSCGELVYGWHPEPLAIGFVPEQRELIKMVGKFMNPPMFNTSGRPSVVFERFVKKQKHPRYRFDRDFEQQHGRSSLFVCPRVGCTHATHKDEQSAVVIPLLGFVLDVMDVAGPKEAYLCLSELLDTWEGKK